MSQLSGQALIDAPLGEVYRKLLEPSEQLRWNSLYLAVQVNPSGEITNQNGHDWHVQRLWQGHRFV